MIKLQEKDTDQETFDFVVGKLREQGKPSVRVTGGFASVKCLYGNPGGCRCAVGHLMGDAPGPGLAPIGDLIRHGTVSAVRAFTLLCDMQVAHDKSAQDAVNSRSGSIDAHVWAVRCAERMRDAARCHRLNPASAAAWLESLQ